MAERRRGPLPMDTILDRDPQPADLLAIGRAIMKAAYLTSAAGEALLAAGEFSPTEIIDEMERARREGLIIVKFDKHDNVTIELTPQGDTERWLLGVGREKPRDA